MDPELQQLLKASGLDIEHAPEAAVWRTFLAEVGLRLGEQGHLVRELRRTVKRLEGQVSEEQARSVARQQAVGRVLRETAEAIAVVQDAMEGRRVESRPVVLEAEADADEGLAAVHDGVAAVGRAVEQLVGSAHAAGVSLQQLSLAGAAQRMLVPASPMTLPQAEVRSWFQPAVECGGDWWSASSLSPEASLVVLGDVTGHGAPSAIIAGTLKGACDLARMGMRGTLLAHQLMRMLNRVIIESANGEYMMTGLAFKLTRGTVWVSNAGHPNPYRVRGGEVTVLTSRAEPPLGAEQVFAYSEIEVPVAPGDLIVCFTDGITETEGENGREFGERALQALVLEHAALGPEALVRAIRDATTAFRGRGLQADDISLVVMKIT